jgi:hypothetical protein
MQLLQSRALPLGYPAHQASPTSRSYSTEKDEPQASVSRRTRNPKPRAIPQLYRSD